MLRFKRGSKYTRPDIKERAGRCRQAKGDGNCDTGVVEHDNEFHRQRPPLSIEALRAAL